MALPIESTLLAEFAYELRPVERGYANRTLYINLDDNTICEKTVTKQMKDLFTGGRGSGLKLLWDADYERRGWDRNSIPTTEKLRELGMDLPELLEVIEEANKKGP